MRRLLITGFEPFGGDAVNPAWQAVRLLPDTLGDFVLRKREIPTVYGEAAAAVLAEARTFRPDVVLCVGLAGGREAVTPERIAVNIRDARIADNAGNQPVGEFAVPGGPAAYFATVPVEAMARAIREVGLPGAVSNTAGTFVCNDTLYLLLHHYAGTPVRVGFLHIPRTPELGLPALELHRSAAALQAAIEVC